MKYKTVCCGVRGRALASHTGVRRFDSRGVDCLLPFPRNIDSLEDIAKKSIF